MISEGRKNIGREEVAYCQLALVSALLVSLVKGSAPGWHGLQSPLVTCQ